MQLRRHRKYGFARVLQHAHGIRGCPGAVEFIEPDRLCDRNAERTLYRLAPVASARCQPRRGIQATIFPRRFAGVRLDQLHVEEKYLRRDSQRVERLDERGLLPELLDVERDCRRGMPAPERSVRRQQRICNGHGWIVRNIEAMASRVADVGFQPESPCKRLFEEPERILASRVGPLDVAAMREDDHLGRRRFMQG